MWRRQEADTCVRSFARLPLTSPQMRATLAGLRGRKAAVVAWGLPSDHRHITVTNGSKDRMRREAMAALRDAGVATRGMMGDVAPATPQVAGMTRRPVVVAIAAAHEVSSAVQPLVDAGLHVQSVVTPALALTSLARLRRAFTVPDATEAYVALDESMMSFALVRNGVLVAARDFAWGYAGEPSGGPQPRPREEIAARLADELENFFGDVGIHLGSETQVCVCGSLPELRSMTVPLMERLDLEVETLDSLFTIDAARLPEPTDEFLEQSAELRLAWAVAADWPQPINLLRERERRQQRTTFAVAAVAAGVAAGLGVGWRIERSAWWQSTASKPAASVARPALRPSTARQAAAAPKSAPANQTPRAVVAMARPLPPPAPPVAMLAPVIERPAVIAAPVVTAPPVVAAPPVVTAAPSRVQTTKPSPPAVAKAASLPPAAAIAKLPPPTAPPVARVPPVTARPAVIAAPVVTAPPAVTASPVAAGARPPALATAKPASAPAVLRRAQTPQREETAPRESQKPEPAPLPFDAVLGTILYSPDRKLAIIDGRIVQPDDDVRGARVIDITPTAVLLRDAGGRLRRLTLGSPGR